MEFRILGLLEVCDGGRVVEVRPAKLRALLAMLVLHPNQVVAADRLIEALWGEAPPASAGNTLQGYVSQLRKLLEPGHRASDSRLVLTRPPGYLLAADREAVDAWRFERQAADGRRAMAAGDPALAATSLAEALSLWRGTALAEFAYEEFAREAIGRLHELQLRAVEDRIDAELALGHHVEVIGELKALTAAAPLRERRWAQLMLALYRAGHQAEALRAYQELRRTLAEELGIDPSPELQRLEQDLLVQEPHLEWRPSPGVAATSSGAATPRHNLPVMRSSFVGRDDELAELERFTATPAVVTIVGPGGSGKSRLALEAARKGFARYPAGTWLVELASITEPGLVPEAVAAALGVRQHPGRSLVESLTNALHGRALLILDNCEHLVEACAELVDALTRSVGDLTIVATSREPLRVDGEVLWRIPTLAVPEDDTAPAEVIAQYDAVRLFVERATAHGNFTWGAAHSTPVAWICRRLDGVPLALELAAARTRVLPPAMIAERLDERFALLTVGARTALPRHQTLRAAVDWSHDLLSEPERVLFRRLSVFAGGFSVSAVEEVCTGGDLKSTQVLDLLALLVDRSLVNVRERDGDVRYDPHETLRVYAAERLVEAGEERATRTRHLTWALAFAEAQRGGIAARSITDQAAVARLELENDNLRHALRWAISNQPADALRLAAILGRFWVLRGYIEEGRRWADMVLAAVPRAEHPDRASVLESAANLAILAGDIGSARRLARQAGDVFRRLGDEAGTASVLGLLSWIAYDFIADYDEAEHLLRDVIAFYARDDDDHVYSEKLARLAVNLLRRGEVQKADGLMADALSYNHRHPDATCPVLFERAGEVAFLRGDFGQARTLLEQALAAQGNADRIGRARNLGLLAEVAFAAGDTIEAGRRFSEQLDVARETGNQLDVGIALQGLARTSARHGDPVHARAAMREAVRIARSSGRAIVGADLECAAAVLAAEGHVVEAARLLGASEARRRALAATMPPAYRLEHERVVSEIASRLDQATFADAWRDGRELTVDEALDAFEQTAHSNA